MRIFRALLVLFFLGCLFVLYGMFIGRTRLQVQYIEIADRKIPDDAQIRLVQISDLHINTLSNYERKVAARINAENPDMILITGDFFKHREVFENPASAEFKTMLNSITEFLSLLDAPHGIFVVRGNNDFGNDKEVSDIFAATLMQNGIHVLANQTHHFNDWPLTLVGVDYPQQGKGVVADFWVVENGGDKMLRVGPSLKNSYSHFWRQFGNWRNYSFSGRFSQTAPNRGGAGFTAYSHMDRGLDRYYRLRRSAATESFVVAPHGLQINQGDRYVDTPILADEWYRFRLNVQTLPDATVFKARVWQDSSPEPSHWQARVVDPSEQRLQQGTVGLWSAGKDVKFFDDLSVTSFTGDTLLFEDFEDAKLFSQPLGWIDFNYEYQALPALTVGLPDSHFSIFLGHTPDFAKAAAAADVDLFVAGHTHGGQIRLPGLGPIFTRTQTERRFSQGMHRIDDTHIYVNRGIGTVLLPIRLFCPPEITVFDLSSSGPR